jgi:hypothetical protein
MEYGPRRRAESDTGSFSRGPNATGDRKVGAGPPVADAPARHGIHDGAKSAAHNSHNNRQGLCTEITQINIYAYEITEISTQFENIDIFFPGLGVRGGRRSTWNMPSPTVERNRTRTPFNAAYASQVTAVTDSTRLPQKTRTDPESMVAVSAWSRPHDNRQSLFVRYICGDCRSNVPHGARTRH